IEQGKPLLEIMTEKINAVVESPGSGVLGRVLAPPGTELPVGALLAVIGGPGDTFPPAEELNATRASAPPAAASHAVGAAASASGAASSASAAASEVLASPAARRLARDLGVEIALVPPSAPGKRITTDDVEAFAAARAAAAPAPAATGRSIPFAGIRKVVAERLHESLQSMAQVTISREADVTGLIALRERLAPGFEAGSGIHLTFTDLLVEIVARLLTEHPQLNATLDGEAIVLSEAVHMGVAVAFEDGLIVPVIRMAHCRPLREIARDRAELATRAQNGTLSLDEVEGGTFTISNLGAFGADSFTPIVNPPQCAILGTGRIIDKPVVVDGEVQVRPTMWLSITFDHRLVDGAPAARFLQALADRLAGQGRLWGC